MSSGVTLSAATRQNLLSLQGTADLLSTTQNRLSTGKTVNSALDNPVNFFTSQSLNARSSSLTSLLDGVSNGIQAIQAANRGITNLQKLTDQLKSTAQQALASSNAFTAKASSVSTAIPGATSATLIAPSTVPSTALGNLDAAAATAQGSTYTAPTGADGTLTINGTAITIAQDADITAAIAAINDETATTGVTAAANADGDGIDLTGPDAGTSFTVTASAASLGFAATATPYAGQLAGPPSGSTLATAIGFTADEDFSVNGEDITVAAGDTLDDVADKIAAATNNTVTAEFDATTRSFKLTSSADVVLADGTGEVSNLGLTAGTTQGSELDTKTLTVQVGNGATTSITFGTGANQVSTLDDLNTRLASANAKASIDSDGKLTISTTNEAGADELTVGGTITDAGGFMTAGTSKATIGGDGANNRDKLVKDFNSLLVQIDQQAKDSGFNGINLLAGDNLKVIFNETNTSSLNVQGSEVTSDNLGLKVVGSTDFQDSNSINAVLEKVSTAVSTLKGQASTLGSNLSVVQNRQDFTKNMINILDTGSANLTNADLNEEAANSQALSTRNSLAISALSLANQSQQGVLQLLR